MQYNFGKQRGFFLALLPIPRVLPMPYAYKYPFCGICLHRVP